MAPFIRRIFGCLAAAVFMAACGQNSEPPEPPEQARPQETAVAAKPPVYKIWMETDPIQCNGNPWEQYKGIGGWTGFFNKKGIQIYDHTTISFNQLNGEPVSVCKGCACPAGHTLYLRVADKDAQALQAYGFKRTNINPANPDTYVGSRRNSAAVQESRPSSSPSLQQKPVRKKRRR